MYQDWAWDAFLALNATCRTDSGFSSISDVNAPGGGDKLDLQESFFFAEVMKYSYLIQAPVSLPSPSLSTCFSDTLDLEFGANHPVGCCLPGRLQRDKSVCV